MNEGSFQGHPAVQGGAQDPGGVDGVAVQVVAGQDYRQGAFHRGWGLRIDLALGTAPIAARCIAAVVDRDERKPTAGEGKPSDHAPLIITLAPV